MALTITPVMLTGTDLQIEISSVFTDIPGITELMPNEANTASEDHAEITHEVAHPLPGLRDNGVFQVTANWALANAVHSHIFTSHQAGTLLAMKCLWKYSGGTIKTDTFSAFVENIAYSAVRAGQYGKATVRFRVHGEVTRS